MDRRIKVLVVEDSAVQREFLLWILQSDPTLHVVGTATNGEQAVEFLKDNKADVVTMDIQLPGMDGFETTRKIMESKPTPVVIVTGTTNPKEVATTFKAMEAGALAVLQIPAGIGHPDHHATVSELLRTVKLMSEVRVIKRWSLTRARMPAARPELKPKRGAHNLQLVAMGASTGGPLVLQTILCGLPRSFPVPILIVQHIAAGFVDGFVHWLSASCRLPVEIAKDRQTIIPGHVYIAPDDMQMLAHNHSVILRKDPPENGLRPAVSALFRSVAQYYGAAGAGILLTGMGRDGADELRQIKDAGGLTIAQSAETCVVNGMPGEAVKLKAATFVLSPEKIAAALIEATKDR